MMNAHVEEARALAAGILGGPVSDAEALRLYGSYEAARDNWAPQIKACDQVAELHLLDA